MKALSLHNPWAVMLASGVKSVETRPRCTIGNYRGPLLVHATSNWNDTFTRVCRDEPMRSALERLGYDPDDPQNSLPFGGVIGIVDLVGCYPVEEAVLGSPGVDGWELRPRSSTSPKDDLVLHVGPEEIEFGDYRPGRTLIPCLNAKMFEKPFPSRGYRAVFNIEDKEIKPWLPKRPANPRQPLTARP